MREFIGATAFVALCSIEPTSDTPLYLVAILYAVIVIALFWATREGRYREREREGVANHR